MFGAEQKIKPKITGFKSEVPAWFYDSEYYAGGGKSNWEKPYDWQNFRSLFNKWASFLVLGFPEARSFLDVGCARGFLEKAVLELMARNERSDVEIEGFDLSPWAIANAEPEIKHLISAAGVDDYSFTRNYDTMISLDTFEHLSEEQTTRFLLRSREHIRDAGFFVIALNEERQLGDPSHVNLKDRTWWDAKFAECGWIADWQTEMMTAMAMKERFIKTCKVEVFIKLARKESEWFDTPQDGKLIDLARLDRWETPKGNGNEN